MCIRDRYYNALELQKAGAAVVLEEKELTGEALIAQVERLLSEPGKLAIMGKMAHTLAEPESLEKIWARLAALMELK